MIRTVDDHSIFSAGEVYNGAHYVIVVKHSIVVGRNVHTVCSGKGSVVTGLETTEPFRVSTLEFHVASHKMYNAEFLLCGFLDSLFYKGYEISVQCIALRTGVFVA